MPLRLPDAGWWRQQGLRTRLTLLATTGIGLGLVLGAAALFLTFAASRLHSVDSDAQAQARIVAALVGSQQLPETVPVRSGQLAQVLTPDGAVVKTSTGTSPTLALVTPEQLARLGDGKARTLTVGLPSGAVESRVVAVRSETVEGPAYAVVAVPIEDEQETIEALGRLELVVVPTLAVLISLLAWQVSGRALRPVEELRRAAESVVDPAATQHLPLPANNDEIHALATTLNAMLDRLAAASRRERGFVDDAAHELRSPLAAARTQLEVALAHPALADWPQVAADAGADLDRLSRVVDDLLVLARLDAATGRPRERVDLAELAGLAPDRAAAVMGDRQALERLVRNLTENAHRHAAAHVEVTVRRDGGTVELVVADDGPGIPAADRDRVFERFTRLDSARSRDAGGSGLGLAIARTTARHHGGDLTVTDSSWGGAAFVLRLPAAPRPPGVE